jgi:hypothetical protein
MACTTLTASLLQACDAIKPAGLAKAIYILEDIENLAATFTADAITAITKGSGVNWYKLTGQRLASSAGTENAAADNAATLVNQTVTFQVFLAGGTAAQEATKRATYNKIVKFQECVIIVERNDGIFEMYGKDYGLKCTGGVTNTGVALADSTIASLIFTSAQNGIATIVDMTTAELDALLPA